MASIVLEEPTHVVEEEVTVPELNAELYRDVDYHLKLEVLLIQGLQLHCLATGYGLHGRFLNHLLDNLLDQELKFSPHEILSEC